MIKSLVFSFLALLSLSCRDLVTAPDLFEGITETDPTGPSPIGNIDPDDWKALFECPPPDTTVAGVPTCTEVFPTYPNPANNVSNFRFAMAATDSVVITLNDRPGHPVRTVVARILVSGMYSVQVDLSGLGAGIYRLYFSIIRSDETITTYGDIQVRD